MPAEKSPGGQTPGLCNRHLLSGIDPVQRRAFCRHCDCEVGIYRGSRRYKANNGWRCVHTKGHRYGFKKQLRCEWCEFSGGHPEMFEIDHRNGNHFDDSEGNHQELCGRCHNLKTYFQRNRIPENQWLALRERYGAVKSPSIIDVSRATSD